MFLTVKEAIDAYINGCKAKAKMSFGTVLVKAVMAGMMIGMGAACSSVAAHSVANVGLARLTAGVVFPVGLMMVILLGAELFTGDCLMVMALPKKIISGFKFVTFLITVYVGNFIGGFLLSGLIFYSGQLDYSGGRLGAYTIKVALSKATLSFEKGVSSGILCNILICAAVLMALCAKDVTGKLMVSFFVIMPFVTGGFEHCVANMYYITAGLMAKCNPAYVELAMSEYGISSAQIDMLNIQNMLVKNLVPVTIGSIIGGSIVIGLVLYFASGNHKDANS